MTKETKSILYDVVERAIDYGQDRHPYAPFDFTELYEHINKLEKHQIKGRCEDCINFNKKERMCVHLDCLATPKFYCKDFVKENKDEETI